MTLFSASQSQKSGKSGKSGTAQPRGEFKLCLYPELIANHLYEPSVRSACLGRSREFRNETGCYTYTSISGAYFPIGVTTGRTPEGYGYRVACPEKALCDKRISPPIIARVTIRVWVGGLQKYLLILK